MIAEGAHRAKVVEADFGVSPKGIKQIGAVFEVRRGPFEGQRLSWWGYFNTKENAERAVRVMKSCGWDGRTLGAMTRNEVEIVVRHEVYEGKTRARVAFVNEVRGLSMKQRLADGDKADLQAKLAGFAKELGLADGVDEPSDDAAVADDGIPF
jgi:hypothetical protein